MKNLTLFLNTYKYKNSLKIKNFRFKRNKFLIITIKSLEILGFLGFCLFHHNLKNLKVFLSFINNSKRNFTTIVQFSNNFHKKFYNFKELTQLKKDFPTGIFLFSTSKGIFSDTFCIKNKIGGILLLWIF